MPEEENVNEYRESIEIAIEGGGKEAPWMRWLPLYTVIIAVVAAVASLASGSFSNESLLEKNNAVLMQNKASDQWNYYQAKGIKGVVQSAFYSQFRDPAVKAEADRYKAEQAAIQKQAEQYQQEVEAANVRSEHLLAKHHKTAFAVTFFQIAIALAGLASLLKRRWFFYTSGVLSLLGVAFLLLGLV
jgi:hypothetical protein